MTLLSTEARFEIENASEIIDDVCKHLHWHGFVFDKRGNDLVFTAPYSAGAITVAGSNVTLKVEASTMLGIGFTRDDLASHLVNHTPDLAGRIVWSGAGADLTQPVQFCFIRVVTTRRISPHMQRIQFSGRDLQRYAGFEDIHMKLMFPHEGDPAPQWPWVEPSGIVNFPGEEALPMRKYTIRRIDVDAGVFEVDFVLHEDAGPGSRFAAKAKPGDLIGMAGMGGRSAPVDRDWYLLAGDETALPAIGRILETLPAKARGIVLVEVADASEEQQFDLRGDFEIRWLHRNGALPGTTSLLSEAVRAVDFPTDTSSRFVWAACERDDFKAIRAHIRKDRKIAKDDSLIVCYWRKGVSRDEDD